MRFPTLLPVLLLAAAASAQQSAASTENWPQFRGPSARGFSDAYPTPVEWNVEKGENILWKTKVPGLAHSSPVIWGDRIYLTTAVKEGEAKLKVGLYGSIAPVMDDSEHQFQVLCFDRTTGEILWTKTAWTGVPKIKRHPKGSHAASTPATNGEYVLAFFGSEGLYAYKADGTFVWQRQFGVLDSGYFRMPGAQWGFASSPVIHGDRVFVQCDVQHGSFVACLDLATGEDIWRTERKDVPTWGTPTVDVREGRSQLILNGWKHIGGYDLATGKELWKLAGGGDIPVPTPVVAGDLVYITNAHGGRSSILAISATAEGEFTMDPEQSDHMVWTNLRDGAYMQTPLVYRGLLYVCKDIGSLSCFDPLTGKRLYRKRLGGFSGFSASPVAADGKLYYCCEDGEVFVLKAGTEFEILAVNEMVETCMASPALSKGTLYFRTRSHLVAVRQGG